jgi:nucleotide-binding universal stress UspA family protein
MLRAALSRVPMREDERTRLEREELDARGFVAKLERMALAVDDSPAGKFAARLAGYVAGARGMPMTVLHVDDPTRHLAPVPTEAHEAEIKEGAERAAAATTRAEADAPRPVDISRPSGTTSAVPDTLAELSRKGFGLLFVGVADTRMPDGGFSSEVTKLANGFEGPVAVLVPAVEGEQRLGSGILIPVTGTDVSRRGAEIGMVIARAAQLSVRALYATPGQQGRSYGRRRRNHEAALKDIAELGTRYDVQIATQLDRHELHEAPILKIAMRRGDLVVMGVSRRPGETLFFGNTAAALMNRWAGPILFVAS